MTLLHRRLALALALLVAAPAAAPALPSGSAAKAAPGTATATASAPAAPARAQAAAESARRAAPAAAPRRLDEVRIEGELEVPRVTFITVRSPNRFRDYTRATSVRSSRRMAADATFPAWIQPDTTTSQDARKESRK